MVSHKPVQGVGSSWQSQKLKVDHPWDARILDELVKDHEMVTNSRDPVVP